MSRTVDVIVTLDLDLPARRVVGVHPAGWNPTATQAEADELEGAADLVTYALADHLADVTGELDGGEGHPA